jgi:hypothetical protein
MVVPSLPPEAAREPSGETQMVLMKPVRPGRHVSIEQSAALIKQEQEEIRDLGDYKWSHRGVPSEVANIIIMHHVEGRKGRMMWTKISHLGRVVPVGGDDDGDQDVGAEAHARHPDEF